MSEIPVERKSGVAWWYWLLGLLLIMSALWFWFGRADRDRVVGASTPEAGAAPASSVAYPPVQTLNPAPASAPAMDSASTPEAGAAPESSVADAPAQALNPAASSEPAMDSAASGAAVTDPGIYAATADKASLAGREVAFTGAKVVRIVGPKTFTISSGGDELLVLIDQDLSSGVGSQGRIDKGVSVDLKGSFQRLQPDTINDISNRRFREMTDLERKTLDKMQVYLHVTKISRLR